MLIAVGSNESVRGPKYVTTRGKTPVLSGDEMRELLESIDTRDLIGLRDPDRDWPNTTLLA
jgi:hypothetical protein